jgi:hypothetical protein
MEGLSAASAGSTTMKISIKKIMLQAPGAALSGDASSVGSPVKALGGGGAKRSKKKNARRFQYDMLSPDQQSSYAELTSHYSDLVTKLCAIEGSWPFHRPVSKSDYPHYYRIIARPLDFGTIRSRIKRNYYGAPSSLLEDIRLVRDNCFQFNLPDHPFSRLIDGIFEVAQREIESSARIQELCHSLFPSQNEVDDTSSNGAAGGDGGSNNATPSLAGDDDDANMEEEEEEDGNLDVD